MDNINSSATEAVQGAVDGITPYYVVPLLRVMVFLCLAMVIMTLVEKVYLAVVVACLKLFRRKPEKQYKWEDMKKDDLEIGDSAYPMVLVQLPMCNEKKALVQEECRRWASKGVNIKCENREHRKGYKAGALKDGMNHTYVKLCEYVVIFDADFQPDPDFLYRTIPYLIHNPNLALVQASWTFVNSDECMLTRMQEMSMDYHFTVEQEVGSAVHAFFGFNGTAGVWRIAALNDAGGWKERTTVEDMDLGCRAALKAWKFLFLGDVKNSTWYQVKTCPPSVVHHTPLRLQATGPATQAGNADPILPNPGRGPWRWLMEIEETKWALSVGGFPISQRSDPKFFYLGQWAVLHSGTRRNSGSTQLSLKKYFLSRDVCFYMTLHSLPSSNQSGQANETWTSHGFMPIRRGILPWHWLSRYNELPALQKAVQKAISKAKETINNSDPHLPIKSGEFCHRTSPVAKNNHHQNVVGSSCIKRVGLYTNLMVKQCIPYMGTVEEKVSIWKKVYLIYAFFFVNKIVAHIVPFTFFCLVLPATILVPQVKVPIWGAVYLPLAVAVLNVLPSPRSFHLVVLWMLFENVMSLHRTIATFIGLLEVGRVNEWVITEKLGNAFNTKTGSKAVNKLPRFSIGERYVSLSIYIVSGSRTDSASRAAVSSLTIRST
nr:glucomannan 4-beta-mannosyltransferase 9-like [Ipomoea batatas]